MQTISQSDIKSFAERVWEKGYCGAACGQVQHTRRLTKAESDMVRETFRPRVEAMLAKFAAMPKRELNKGYDHGYVEAFVRLDSVDVKFFIDECVHTRFVNGRQIRDLMTVDEVMKHGIRAFWYPNGGDWHDAQSYEALTPDEDGMYTYRSRSTIRQGQTDMGPRGGFNRTRSKADFVRLVKNYVKQNAETGWTPVSTRYEDKYRGEQLRLDFAKPDPVESSSEAAADANTSEGGLGISAVQPLEKDLSRICAIIDQCGDDRTKAVGMANLMNSKIKDEKKRARRKAACVAFGVDWLAECFSV